MRRRIAEAWQRYVDKVLPEDVGAIQLEETRKAFWAGAAAVFGFVTSVDESTPDAEGISMLDDLNAELAEYCERLGV